MTLRVECNAEMETPIGQSPQWYLAIVEVNGRTLYASGPSERDAIEEMAHKFFTPAFAHYLFRLERN